jgi:oxygen-independent coproporphyrinogen III oxidase
MWPYHPDLLARPVPRYTSFPTAVEFGPAVGANDLEGALREVSGDISLYIHLPFCEKICWYCGCNTGAAGRQARLASYLEALHREIALVGALFERRVRVRRVAFGGGSPNALSPTDFVRLVTALTFHFPLVEPLWSIELDPRTLTEDWGLAIASIGISHASLGVQTFAPHIQQAIGRVQPDADIARATALLRRCGITSLNFDLMYGLPGQTREDLEASLRRSVELGANRIALFGYAHVPHMIPRQKRIDASQLPDQDERFAMAVLGHDLLAAAGYLPVGFDHFALPGDPLAQASVAGRLHRNFQGFTEDDAPTMIGLGASAISSFPALLAQNEKNTGRYRMLLSQDHLPTALGIVRSPADQATALLIEHLLCQGQAEISAEQWQHCDGALQPFIDRELAEIDGARLRILPHGLPYARTIAALFDPYRHDQAKRFSSAV